MTTKKQKIKRLFKILAFLILGVILIFLGFFIYLNAKINYYKQTIDLDKNKLTSAYLKPTLYSNNSDVLNTIKCPIIVDIKSIPEQTKNAFISIEDKNFYSHSGINAKRIIKAVLTNIKSKSFKEGASTISQQLIKNTLLSSEKSIDRKIKEMALTQKLEQNFSKDEILEIYLNSIYFGNNIYGIGSAAKTYFNKNIEDINLNESTILASVIKSPSFYTRPENENALTERKNLVLNELFKDGKINEDELSQCLNTPAKLQTSQTSDGLTSFQNAVISEACEKLNISEKELISGRFNIYTYFDQEIQNNLTSSINQSSHAFNIGGVVLDNATSGVCAVYSNMPNFATLKRQTGSTIKPFLAYIPAIDSGKYIPDTPILDEKININGYSPKNASGTYYGYVSLGKAAEKSLNIPAVKICNDLGLENCKNYAAKCGFEFTKDDNNLSLALGSSQNGFTPITLAGAYSSLANNGEFEPAHFIKEIKDQSGKTVYKHSSSKQQAFSKETAYFVNKMLSGVAKNGTAKTLAKLNLNLASKTGTVGIGTNGENSDAYNISYTKDKTFLVWTGSDDNKPENLMPKNINGSTIPTQIMFNLLEKTYENKKTENFDVPENIQSVCINANDYSNDHKLLLAQPNTPDRFKMEVEIPSFFKLNAYSEQFKDKEKNELNKVKIDILSQQFIFR